MYKNLLFSSSCMLALIAGTAQAQMTLPQDVDTSTCSVDLSGWLDASGAVAAPSSVTFTDDHPNGGQGPNVCNFYQWGTQAFLWLMSPDGSGLVLDGEQIYNVSTETKDKDGKTVRYLQNAAEVDALNVKLRAEKGDDEIGETGQAGGGGVLMSQNKSLVYYGVHVNDVYADFLTGQMAGKIDGDPTDFPHNGADLEAVQAYIDAAGLDQPMSPEALTLELKTSWVDAASVKDPSQYITMPAIVPTYTADATNTTWSVGAEADMTLALVGIHIVGTVQDHPEFVWATFEHLTNAPDESYWYNDTSGGPKEFPFDSSGDFLFLPTGATTDGANTECMKTVSGSAGDIATVPNTTAPTCDGGIVPSNTTRTRPWGSTPYGPSDVGQNGVTQAQVDKVIANNTMLVSLNNAVIAQLPAGDARANYVQTGGVWTTTPAGGGDAPIPNWKGDETSQMRGSLGLYNATMETYSQAFAPNCFTCHQLSTSSADSFVPFGLSHIYSEIVPLATK